MIRKLKRTSVFRVVKNSFPSVYPGDIFSGTQNIGVREIVFSIVLSQRLEMRTLSLTTVKNNLTNYTIHNQN